MTQKNASNKEGKIYTQIRKGVKAIMRTPNQVIEVRVIIRKGRSLSGYYDNPEKLISDVRGIDGQYKAIYILLNPCNPALLGRAYNRLQDYAENTTSDNDIINRQSVLIDIDPNRPAGISSSQREHDEALRMTRIIREFLTTQGFPLPIEADSGNGGHLIYGIDLPNNQCSLALINRFLNVLASRFDNLDVSIDTTVGNAARITKLYGTMVKKGDHIPNRPHRRSQVLQIPDNFEIISPNLIEKVIENFGEE